jgi:hypothetical protein
MPNITIRPAYADEAPVLATIEAAGFPPAEAASLESITTRLRVFPEQFFVAEADGKAVGFINGCVSDVPNLPDAYYHDATLHQPDGAYATVFGLVVLPEYRGQGIASKLLQHYLATMQTRGKRGVILTCKEQLTTWYERHGFTNHGIADSSHGGATWYDMKAIWQDMTLKQTLLDMLHDKARLQQFIARHQQQLRDLSDNWQRFLQDEAQPTAPADSATSFNKEENAPPAETSSPENQMETRIPAAESVSPETPETTINSASPSSVLADSDKESSATTTSDNSESTAAASIATSEAPRTDIAFFGEEEPTRLPEASADLSDNAPPQPQNATDNAIPATISSADHTRANTPPATTLDKLDAELQIDLSKSATPEPAMPIPPHTPTPTPVETRITLSPLPPANEGQPYERKLPPDSPVLNIGFGQDCGLAWDGDARRIHGTPTISGDVQLTITISHDGKQHDIIQPLHINPDPKSLWQDNPSDQSAPFAKPDSAETLQDTPHGRLLAARVRGRSHAHVGSYCDDDYRINWHEASGIHLLIVSDGAGSASHARLGSQLAVNTAADTILNLLGDTDKGYHRLAQLNSEQRAQISEFLIARALHAAHTAHRTAAQETGIAEKSLSCTLLIALTLPLAAGGWYSAGYQVGDGAAALWLPEGGELHLLGTADSGAYSGETQFLTAAQLQPEDYRRRIRINETASAPSVILMTDGVSDAKFETDAALADAQHWRAFWQDSELQAALAAEDPKAALHEWLGFWSRGNHDDRTIAFFLPSASNT